MELEDETKLAGDIPTEEAPVPDEEPAGYPAIDWVQRAQAAYTASTDYFDANIRSEIEASIRQFNGEHPTGSKYLSEAYRGRSRLFRPKTRAAVTAAEATAAEALFSSYDVVNVEALDKDDPLQVQAASFAKQLLQIRLSTSIPWFLIAMGAFQEANVAGVVVSKQDWFYHEGPIKKTDRPEVSLVPIENFRFDPAASWVDPVGTSPYLIQLLPLYVKDVRARVANGTWLPVSESEIRSAAGKPADSIRLTRTGRSDETDNSIAVSDYSIVWVHENIVEEDGRDWLYYTLGTTTLLSAPVPMETKYPHGRPFAVGFTVVEAHKIYPSSLPRISRDVQAEINNIANQRIDNVSFAMNKRYFVKRGKQVDLRSLTRNVPGSVTLMDSPDTDVVVQSTPDVTGSAYQEQDRLNLDFDEVVGVFSGSSVQSNRRLNETVGGMNLLSNSTNKVTNYRLRCFVESWVEPVLRQLLQLERHYETDSVLMQRAAQAAEFSLPAGVPAPEVFDALLAGDVLLNVNVGMSATSPVERIQTLLSGFRAVKELLADNVLVQYGLDVRELIKEVFAGIGYRDGSRFFSRSDDPNLAALESQVQQLQQALDAKISPELLAAQVAKLAAETERILVEKVQTGVQTAYSAMQAAQVIAAAPAVAPIADEIMAGAGYQDGAGQDPNFPAPAAPVPGITQLDINNRKTGVQFNPTGQSPASPNEGQATGIETQRNDGVMV